MQAVLKTLSEVTVVRYSGKCTLGEGTALLRNTIRELLRDGCRKIVLDLSKSGYFDASGIGELVSAFTTTTNQGGELRLANVPPELKDLLVITKLYTVFEVHDSEEAAIASFKS